jgi:uncharacterized membrane protein YgcG
VRRVVLRALLVVVVVLVAMQLVPYGWKHSNPPVQADAPWPSAKAEAIARESCYSCHSNETKWPVYAYVAPMSWLVRSDVDDGRKALNFSTWGTGDNKAHDAEDMISTGEMPPSKYTIIHRKAKLTGAEKRTLIAALKQMEGSGGSGGDTSGKGSSGSGGDNSGKGSGGSGGGGGRYGN